MVCGNCSQRNPMGAIFCLECGMSVEPSGQPAPSVTPRKPLLQRAAPPNPTSATPTARLCITVLQTGRQIHVPCGQPVLVGRHDQARGVQPDLDLSSDGGYNSGVSRRHARISVQSNVLYVEDLESANGSFLNNQRLDPRTPYRVQPSDELRFGSLTIRIEPI